MSMHKLEYINSGCVDALIITYYLWEWNKLDLDMSMHK